MARKQTKTQNLLINPEDAPKGYYAAPQEDLKEGCPGCAFEGNKQCSMDLHCCASEREDKQNVVFKKK